MGLKIGWSDRFAWSYVKSQPNVNLFFSPKVWRELRKRGHEVYYLQETFADETVIQTELANVDFAQPIGSALPESLDIVFLVYRWRVPAHPEMNAAVDRQTQIIEKYYGKCPIVAFDGDLTIDTEFEKAWPEIVIAEPSANPSKLERERYRLFFPIYDDETQFDQAPRWSAALSYVGNNYRRLQSARKYYSKVSEIFDVSFFGNWMVESAERPPPRIVKRNLPFVHFNDRVPISTVKAAWQSGFATINIAPSEYYAHGLFTPRYAEAAMYGLISLVPQEFALAESVYGKEFVVSSGKNATATLTRLLIEQSRNDQFRLMTARNQYHRLVETQIFNVNKWVNELGNAVNLPL